MNKEDLSLLKTPLHPSDGLMTFYPDSTSNNNKESPYLTKEPQNPPRKRLNTHSNHKAGSASSYDKKRQDRTILIPSEMGYRQNFLSEKTENGQRLPQSATSNLSKRRVKVRTGSGSSKIPVDAAWSTVVQGGVPVEGIQNGKENRVNEGVRVSEAEAGRISCNTTAVFGDSGALNVVQKSSGNRFQVRNISTPTTHIIKEDNSPMSAVEFSSTKSGVKLGSQRELMDSQASNRYMEFTLSGFMKENNAENRSESQKGTRRENQSLALDTRKGNNDEQQRFSGVHSSREERERPRNVVIHRENSHDLRKSNQLGIPSYGSMVPGNKSMETSQERAKGTKRKEYENSNTPSQEYGKSPRSRLLLNLTHNKKSNSYTPEHENIGVKKLVEENSHLRKENDQKEELIGLLINALKQKEVSNNNPLDLSPTPLPTIESYLSPKDNVQRFSFNRSRLTSAEKPFSSGTPNRFTQKSHGLIVPSRDGLGEIVAVERGRSNEAVRLFENSTAQTLPTLSIPSAQKSQLITVVDQSRVQTVNEILSAKRIYSSPLPKQPEHENFSHYPPGFGPNRISMQKNMMLKGNSQHHPLINLKSNLNGNGRVLMSYQQLPEGKPEYESLPKVNMHEYEYGFQRRKSRDTSSEYVLKQGVPEIKILSVNNMDTLGSQKMKDPTPLNAMFNPGEFITGTFQSKNFRVKSPGQRYNSQLNLDSKIKSQEDMKYQSACEIDAKTVLSSNRETEFSGLKAANGLKEVKSYGSLQKEVVQREGSRLQNMYKNNENREVGHGEREGKSVEELSKSKTRKDKFPKEVFSMNIRRKFFC